MAGRFLVYTEGETEAVYIKELLHAFGCQDLGRVVVPVNRSPLGMLEEMAKEIWWGLTSGAGPYECGWIFFDQDHHQTYETALETAKKLPFIRAVWSNPCVESWFLMHFVNVERALPLDSEFILEKDETRRKIDEDVYELKTCKRARAIVSPGTAEAALKQIWPGYRKNSSEGYLKQLQTNMGRALHDSHNTTNPRHPGSAFPDFIRFLEEISPGISDEFKAMLSPRHPFGNLMKAALEYHAFESIPNRMPQEIHGIFYKLLSGLSPEPLAAVRERLEDVQKFLAFLPFATDKDADTAFFALMTAAMACGIPHCPVIVLNCEGTGRAKEYFEDILCRVMEPAEIYRGAFPASEKSAQLLAEKNADYMVLKAGGKLTNYAGFKTLWLGGRTPLIVIVGNKLDASEFAGIALEVRFSTSRGARPFTEEELSAGCGKARSALRQISFYRNLNGNKALNGKGIFTLWKGLVNAPLIWVNAPHCADHLRNDI